MVMFFLCLGFQIYVRFWKDFLDIYLSMRVFKQQYPLYLADRYLSGDHELVCRWGNLRMSIKCIYIRMKPETKT